MPWSVTLSPRAQKELRSLPASDRPAVLHALRRLPEEFGAMDVKKLEGAGSTWRLRVGRWRVLFDLNNREGLIAVVRVIARDRAYR